MKTSARPGSATRAGGKAKKRHKFNAAGEFVEGVWQASAAQAERYRQLLKMQGEGRIDRLRCEVPFDLLVKNKLICRYRADFCYDVIDDMGQTIRSVVEDVKGMITPEFIIKSKLFAAIHEGPVTVIDVRGKAAHSQTGEVSAAGWVDLHWKDRLPD